MHLSGLVPRGQVPPALGRAEKQSGGVAPAAV